MPPPRPVLVIAAMCVAEVLSMGGYATFSALASAFQRSWSLSDVQIGWIGGSYFAGMAIGTVLLPAITDRIDARIVYVGSLLLGAMALLAFAGMVETAAGAAVARCVQGFGLAGTYFPGLRALLGATPASYHRRATAFYTSIYSVGTSLSFFLSGVIEHAFGYRVALAVLAGGPIIAILVAVRVLTAGSHEAAPAGPLLNLRPVLRDSNVRRHAIAYAALYGQILVLQTWLVLLLFGADTRPGGQQAATVVAGITLSAVPSSLFGNAVAERFGRRRVIMTVMVASLTLFVATFAAARSPVWLVGGCALVLFAVTTMNSASITNSLRETCPPEQLGRPLSVYALAGAVGAMAAPFVFGVVLDRAGGEQDAGAWAWSAVALGTVFACGPLAMSRFGR